MKRIKVVLAAVIMIIAMSSIVQAKQLWGLVAEFRTEDLIKLNAWEHIGKNEMGYKWGMIERDTADLEVGYIVGIIDTEDPEIKQVGFFFDKLNTYRVDYNSINYYVYYITRNFWEPSARSIGMNYHPFPIDMDYKG